MKKAIGFLIFMLHLNSTYADTRDKVLETLGHLSGCFEVQYQFVEDGTHDKTYKPIIEYIRPSENQGEIILEHIGQYPLYNEDGSPKLDQNGNPSYFVQYHWREHWTEQADEVWLTKVYGPYEKDNFRYECQSKWTMGQFHCHTEAAKPRRHNARPYDKLFRINNLQVNAKTWVHAQRNKMLLQDGSLYSTEMGWNTYKRIDLKNCQPAVDSNAQPLPN